MARFVHFDEARRAAIDVTRAWLANRSSTTALLLITDLFGKLRAVAFPGGDMEALGSALQAACGPWWTGEAMESESLDTASKRIFDQARQQAQPDDEEPRLAMLDRHRSRTGWFANQADPPWQAPGAGAPVVVFYSFKGGLGRSTLLASFAIQRARAGQRVCVIDMDLDSPGVGRLLGADREGLVAPWGAVDFLLEHHLPGMRFDDYWHRCDRVAGNGEIRVMPAGRLDEAYAGKLARIDFEEPVSSGASGLSALLENTRSEFAPDWILLDARTGISEPAGLLLAGIAHLHVLLGTFQEQSWQGLDRVLDRLGKDRILGNRSQAEMVLVQAMVPAGEPGKWAIDAFAGRAEEAFENRYYADADSDSDVFWTVDDQQAADAPHVPVPIEYESRLASFKDIEDVADALTAGMYATLDSRIVNRFAGAGDA